MFAQRNYMWVSPAWWHRVSGYSPYLRRMSIGGRFCRLAEINKLNAQQTRQFKSVDRIVHNRRTV